MASGREFMSAGKRGSTGKKNANCSFCRKSYREVGPLVEGPDEVYICGECIELCQNILDQEKKRRGGSAKLFNRVPSPREITEHLNQYVIGQDRTKKILSVAVHNHYKRLMATADLDNEVLEMIMRAEPLPPFPESMPQARIDLTVPIRFSLR